MDWDELYSQVTEALSGTASSALEMPDATSDDALNKLGKYGIPKVKPSTPSLVPYTPTPEQIPYSQWMVNIRPSDKPGHLHVQARPANGNGHPLKMYHTEHVLANANDLQIISQLLYAPGQTRTSFAGSQTPYVVAVRIGSNAVSVVHPATGQPMTLTTPLPESLFVCYKQPEAAPVMPELQPDAATPMVMPEPTVVTPGCGECGSTTHLEDACPDLCEEDDD